MPVFLNILEKSNVSYVSWKNNHELNFALTGEFDLDILIFNTSVFLYLYRLPTTLIVSIRLKMPNWQTKNIFTIFFSNS